MAISATAVKELRDKTGLGMMVCKKALTEVDGDMNQAIENLRKQGEATAAKRAGKAAKEGKISVRIDDNSSVIYQVNSETDFVARNEDFTTFTEALGAVLIAEKPGTLDEAKKLSSPELNGNTVEARLLELVAKIGENISFHRFHIEPIDASSERIFSYIHGGGKIGVIVKLHVQPASVLDSDSLAQLGKDIAMQVAASNPMAVDRDSVPVDIVAKEKEIYLSQAQNTGKPEKVLEKIVSGKLEKFFKETALLEQLYIKDQDMTISDRIAQCAKELDATISVTSFVRYELGIEE